MEKRNTEEPVDLLSDRLDLFIEMKALALEQEELLVIEDMDGFRDRVARRDHLQRQITANDRKYRECIQARSTPPTDPKEARIREDIIQQIRSIQEIDQNIEYGLTQKKDLFLSELKQIRNGQKAIRGYGRNPVRPPRFIDRQG